VTKELDVSVRRDGLWYTMQSNNINKEDMGYVRCIRGLHAMDEVCNFEKSVNYYENRVHTLLVPQHTNPLSVQSL
jgi:hypothetical protein